MPCSKMFTTGVKWSQLPSKICKFKEKKISEKITIDNVWLSSDTNPKYWKNVHVCAFPPSTPYKRQKIVVFWGNNHRCFKVTGSFRSLLTNQNREWVLSSAVLHFALVCASRFRWRVQTIGECLYDRIAGTASANFSRKGPMWNFVVQIVTWKWPLNPRHLLRVGENKP